jgi:hypothetical protein
VRYEDESQPVIERFFTRIDLEKIGDINSVWSEFNFFLETTPEIDGSRNLKVSIEGLCKDLDVMFHKLSSKGEATKGRD